MSGKGRPTKTKRRQAQPKQHMLTKVRLICRLRDVNNFTYAKIAKKFGCTTPSIYFLYTRWGDWCRERRMEGTQT